VSSAGRYHYWHEDYTGNPEDNRCGLAESYADAKWEIDQHQNEVWARIASEVRRNDVKRSVAAVRAQMKGEHRGDYGSALILIVLLVGAMMFTCGGR
jgi:hypothetical protein